MIYYIYIIQNKINNKIYVGQTIHKKDRWSKHLYNVEKNPNKSPHLYSSIKKHGKDNFSYTVIEEHYTQNNANEAECFWIEFFQSRNKQFGYNIKNGGSNGSHSLETRKKISEKVSGKNNGMYGVILSIDIKNKISKALTGVPKKPEHIKNMSLANKGQIPWIIGKHHSEETKIKISKANIGKPKSEEHKQKLSQAQMGKPAPNKGKPHSFESKLKMRESQRKNSKMTQELADQIRLEYFNSNISQQEMAVKYNTNKSMIRNIIYNITWNKQ